MGYFSAKGSYDRNRSYEVKKKDLENDKTLPVLTSVERMARENIMKRRKEKEFNKNSLKNGFYPISLLKDIMVEDEIFL